MDGIEEWVQQSNDSDLDNAESGNDFEGVDFPGKNDGLFRSADPPAVYSPKDSHSRRGGEGGDEGEDRGARGEQRTLTAPRRRPSAQEQRDHEVLGAQEARCRREESEERSVPRAPATAERQREHRAHGDQEVGGLDVDRAGDVQRRVRQPEESGRGQRDACLLYTSPSPRDMRRSRMPSSA